MNRACALLLALAVAVGCSATGTHGRAPVPTRTCAVLSVGEFYGIAHAGVLRQLQRQGVRIDCVVGNSMGSVVGALYAADPKADPVERMRGLLQAYVVESEREFSKDKLKYLAAEAVKRLTDGGLDLGAFRRLSHARFVRVLDAALGHRAIEQLALPYATFHQRKDGGGLRLVTVVAGNAADAIGASAANPLIFEDIDLKVAARIDPGADRLSALPVSDACRLFPGARLIAVNVTGEPMALAAGVACPVQHIVVARRPVIDREEAAQGGAEFDRLVAEGEAAAASAALRR
ncbi:MAG: patatin-like phospholipase family protein [Deltaproteobacteria bacterium]|nr:patatin-like phospholipase family protein [Deltaproteobacteria bacterium]